MTKNLPTLPGCQFYPSAPQLCLSVGEDSKHGTSASCLVLEESCLHTCASPVLTEQKAGRGDMSQWVEEVGGNGPALGAGWCGTH